MKEFLIDGEKVIKKSEKIMSKDTFSACLSFKLNNPDFNIIYINDFMLLGFCDVCGEPITENDYYCSDNDGIYWCKKHGVEGDK